MARFPSMKWFEEARKLTDEDRSLRRLGNIDTTVGIKSGKSAYLLRFDGFECAEVKQADEDGLLDADFYLDMPKKRWDAYLDSLSGSDRQSLNGLDLEEGIVKSHDPLRAMAFLRYHLSLEAFFAAGAVAASR